MFGHNVKPGNEGLYGLSKRIGKAREREVFRCERCGSSYSARHAVALQNCPRCQVRDKVSAPLTFKAFTLPDEVAPPSPPAEKGRFALRPPG